MQRKGASCPAGEVAPWRSYDGKQDGGSSKHQDEGSRPPQPSLFWVLDPPKWKTLIDKHMCTPAVLFAAALVTKTGKQPRQGNSLSVPRQTDGYRSGTCTHRNITQPYQW